MEKKIKRISKTEIQVKVTVFPEELINQQNSVLKEMAQKMKVDGFREGKVPLTVAKQKIPAEKLLSHTAEHIIEKSYKEIVKEEKLEPITQPKVEILKLALNNPFEFQMTFTVLPEISLPDYKKIAQKVKKEESSITKKEIEETLQWLQKARPNLKKVLRPAQKGDFVEISFSAPEIENGKVFQDGFILGEGQTIPGFQENILGLSANEKKDFSLTLPENFVIKDVAGQKANFNVQVNSIQEVSKREINDEFAQKVGEFKNLEELKKSIEKGLKEEKENAQRQKRREEIIKNIEKETKIDIPKELVERDKESRLQAFKERIKKEMGSSFSNYLKQVKKTEAEIEKEIETLSRERAKRFLILREIAHQEKIAVSEDEVEERVKKLLEKMPNSTIARQEIDPREIRNYTKEDIKAEKTLNLLEDL